MSLRPVSIVPVGVLVVAVFASVLVWGVSSVRAATPFFLVGGFAEVGPFGGSGDGFLHHGNRIAVDSSGLVLRADPIGKRVVVYSPSESGASESASFGSGELVAPFGVAVDRSTGSVYVSDAGSEDVGGRVVRYLTDGGGSYWLDGDYTSPVAGSGAGEVGDFQAAIALDPTSGKLLVADPADDLVQRYATDGSYDGFSFDGADSPAGVFTGLQDLAVDSTGDVIVVDSDGGDPADGAVSRVERFDSLGVWEASIGPVSGAANVAVRPFNDDVLVSGNQDAVNRDEFPTLFVFDAEGGSVEVSVRGSDSKSAAFSTIAGLAVGEGLVGRLYVATDSSRGNYPGLYGLVSVQAYVPPGPPVIASIDGLSVTPTTGLLRGRVDPEHAQTSYRFEYGLTDSYGDQTPTVSAGSGGEQVQVSRWVKDLQPATTYHYRLVADNGIGDPVASPDQTFTTPAIPLPEPSPVATGVDGITQTTATVTGTVDTHGQPGTASLGVIQTDGRYSQTTATVDLQAIDGPQTITIPVTGLPAGASFEARVSANTAAGTRASSPITFTTQPAAGYQPPAPPPADDGDWFNHLAGPPAPPAKPSNRFTARSKIQGTKATLTIGVPGRGTIRAAGKRLATAVKRPGAKGTATLELKLTKQGRKALKNSKTGRLAVAVTITYTPTGGTPKTTTRTLTFKRGSNR